MVPQARCRHLPVYRGVLRDCERQCDKTQVSDNGGPSPFSSTSSSSPCSFNPSWFLFPFRPSQLFSFSIVYFPSTVSAQMWRVVRVSQAHITMPACLHSPLNNTHNTALQTQSAIAQTKVLNRAPVWTRSSAPILTLGSVYNLSNPWPQKVTSVVWKWCFQSLTQNLFSLLRSTMCTSVWL